MGFLPTARKQSIVQAIRLQARRLACESGDVDQATQTITMKQQLQQPTQEQDQAILPEPTSSPTRSPTHSPRPCPPSPSHVASKARSCNDMIKARAAEEKMLHQEAKARARSQRLSPSPEEDPFGVRKYVRGTTLPADGDVGGASSDDQDVLANLAAVAGAPGNDPIQCISVAMSFLRQCQQKCDQTATHECVLPKDAIDQLLDIFNKALASTKANEAKGVEQELKQLFLSHANVFDDKVQNFIMQNYIHESDDAANLREALRRKSLVRRCLQAMYPSRSSSANSPPKATAAAAGSSEPEAISPAETQANDTGEPGTNEGKFLTPAASDSQGLGGGTVRDEHCAAGTTGMTPINAASAASSNMILAKESIAQLKQRKHNMSMVFLSSFAASPLASLSIKQAEEVQQQLANLSAWDFDLFALSQAVPGQALALVGNELFQKYEIASHFRTTQRRISEFLQQVQGKYLGHPYHNAEHAADVAQSLHHFFACGGIGCGFPPKNKAIAILAAVVHDLGHTGFSNNFHISCNDDLAIQYVYRSPLEHMHCAMTFQLMKNARCDILAGLTKVQQQEVRNFMADLVLATDNSVHSVYLGKLEALVRRAASDENWRLSEPDDEKTVLQMALHAADVSNPAKPIRFGVIWAERIMKEFYQQGDRERELQLPVSAGCDRENPIPVEKIQAGFIIGIARPLFNLIRQLPDVHLTHCIQHLDENLVYWQHQILQTMPSPSSTSTSGSGCPTTSPAAAAENSASCSSSEHKDSCESNAECDDGSDSDYGEEQVETIASTDAAALFTTPAPSLETTPNASSTNVITDELFPSSSCSHHRLPC